MRADVTFYSKLTKLSSGFQTIWADYCKEHIDSYEQKETANTIRQCRFIHHLAQLCKLSFRINQWKKKKNHILTSSEWRKVLPRAPVVPNRQQKPTPTALGAI